MVALVIYLVLISSEHTCFRPRRLFLDTVTILVAPIWLAGFSMMTPKEGAVVDEAAAAAAAV